MTTVFTLHGENLWIRPDVFSTFVALREKGIYTMDGPILEAAPVIDGGTDDVASAQHG